MGLATTHPQYDQYVLLWEKCDDMFQGQDHVKSLGVKYLPALPSMIIDGMETTESLGYKRYSGYKQRANVSDAFSKAVSNYIGLLHRKPAVIEVPEAMKPLLLKCTRTGEDIQQLLRRINELQLKNGRLGILLDLPKGETVGTLPYIAVYGANAIRNWDDGTDELGQQSLNMVVLDESGNVRNHEDFSWKWETRYRLLMLGTLSEDEVKATYSQGLYVGADSAFDSSLMVVPQFRGQSLEEIPFQFINTTDITSEIEPPPLLGLANKVISLYCSDADYRFALFMGSQDTLVVKGGLTAEGNNDKAPQRVGAGARIDVQENGDAKYIGVSGTGLPEQRKAIEADRKDADTMSGELVGPDQSSQESGEAMKTRIASRTASLIRIAYTGAAALENLLKTCARWMGEDEDKVKVIPNTEFAKSVFLGQDFVQLMTARNLSAPISLESIHQWQVDNGMTTMSFEDEMAIIEQELKKWPLPEQAKADLNAEQQAQTKAAKKPDTTSAEE